MKGRNQSFVFMVFMVLTAALAFLAAGYAAYKGHANDADVEAVLSAYPALKDSATDSCATCHNSGAVADSTGRAGKRHENHCGYCHEVYVQKKRDVRETLNLYGAAYLAAGRGVAAVKKLAAADPDGDGIPSDAEFLKGTNAGDPASNPSASIAPHRVFTAAELRKMAPVMDTPVFLNTSHNRAGDFYNSYRGIAVHDMLRAAGISESAESVDFISLDGYEGSFAVDFLQKAWPQAAPVRGLQKSEANPCGWVNYNVPGLDPARALPDLRVLLAFEENGKKIEAARMNPETGKITGTGPLRLVVPQTRVSPPDVPQYADQACQAKAAPEHRFNASYDHNGGRSSFSIIAIRINPLPEGTRDFEWEKIRRQFVEEEKLVIFGNLKKDLGEKGSEDPRGRGKSID